LRRGSFHKAEAMMNSIGIKVKSK